MLPWPPRRPVRDLTGRQRLGGTGWAHFALRATSSTASCRVVDVTFVRPSEPGLELMPPPLQPWRQRARRRVVQARAAQEGVADS